jgi:hypothetical protein
MEAVLLLEISLIRREENPDADAFFRGFTTRIAFKIQSFILTLTLMFSLEWDHRVHEFYGKYL